MPCSILQISVSLLEEKFELLFDPGYHLLILVQDATLAEKQRKKGIFVRLSVGSVGKRLVYRLESLL